jgi:hypothetical protein
MSLAILSEIHGSEKVARAICDALVFEAIGCEYIANILQQREHLAPVPGALHLTRRQDLFDLNIPAPGPDSLRKQTKPLPMKPQPSLFQEHLHYLSRRYERGSIALTTTKPFKQWSSIFNNDSTIASAVLDRLLHHADTVSTLVLLISYFVYVKTKQLIKEHSPEVEVEV